MSENTKRMSTKSEGLTDDEEPNGIIREGSVRIKYASRGGNAENIETEGIENTN